MNISPSQQARAFMGTLRAELRARRENRAVYKTIQRELGSYTTARDVDDLLGTIQYDEGPEAEQVREFLLGNLRQPTTELFRLG